MSVFRLFTRNSECRHLPSCGEPIGLQLASQFLLSASGNQSDGASWVRISPLQFLSATRPSDPRPGTTGQRRVACFQPGVRCSLRGYSGFQIGPHRISAPGGTVAAGGRELPWICTVSLHARGRVAIAQFVLTHLFAPSFITCKALQLMMNFI